MKQPRVIQRLSSLLLAVLLLFTAVYGRSSGLPVDTLPASKSVAEQAKSGKAAQSKETQLRATQLEAVVAPAVQLGDSGQPTFLLPTPTLIILLLLSVALLRHFTIPPLLLRLF